MKDEKVKGTLIFFNYNLDLLGRLNLIFQSEKVIVNRAFDLICNIYKDFFKRFMKAEYLSDVPVHMINPYDSREYLQKVGNDAATEKYEIDYLPN